MNRLITLDDLIDTYAKTRQRGFQFISSKFNFNSIERTKSAWNDLDIQASNWWIIPKVQLRWNKLITKDETLDYETFVVENFLDSNKKVKMLSLGSGACGHELSFALHKDLFDIFCVWISVTMFWMRQRP